MAQINSFNVLESRAPFSSVFERSPHRPVWFASLAAGAIASFAMVWGHSSREAAVTEEPLADAAIFADACERGDAVACNDLGVTFLKGYGVPADAARAFQAFERSCKEGSPDACSNLGAMYEGPSASSATCSTRPSSTNSPATQAAR